MKNKLFLSLLMTLLVFSACKDEKCADMNQKLELQLEEYEKREKFLSEAMTDYDKSIDEYKLKNDTLKMFQDSVRILTQKMDEKGSANSEETNVLKKYMTKIRTMLSENKKIAKYLKEYVGDKDLGANPALAVEFLAKNIESKEVEIKSMQDEIERLKNRISGLNYTIVTISAEKDELTDGFDSLKVENTIVKTQVAKLLARSIKTQFYGKSNKNITKALIRLHKRAKFIEICFNINKNEYATKGNHSFYICIQKGNNILTNNTSNILRTPDNKEFGYTIKQDVNFDGSFTKTCARWNKETIELTKGKYTIIIYNKDGEIIGRDYFSL